jgi:hypothetical protein
MYPIENIILGYLVQYHCEELKGSEFESYCHSKEYTIQKYQSAWYVHTHIRVKHLICIPYILNHILL